VISPNVRSLDRVKSKSSLADATLEAADLEIWRGERCLCLGLGFKVRAGELALVRGPNGSGKTTLIRVLAGLGLLETGNIHWRGRSIREAGPEYRAELAYLGHLNGIKAALTPLENLHAALALNSGTERQTPRAALRRVGLERFAEVDCRALSAGQKRRVALARLLIADVPLWFLDEPLTSLDVEGIALVEAMLGEHLADGGIAVVATHQPLNAGAAPIVSVNLGAEAP
jgi:heme exporter protein A